MHLTSVHRSRTLLLAPAALALASPLILASLSEASAAENGADQVTSISQFSDIRPTDWAYQAISNLIEGYGCVTGYPATKFLGRRPLSRWEAAAALNACLDRISDQTDALKRLLKEFEKERAVITGRVDGLQARVGELEASRFSTTTRLRGEASIVLGANRFNGSDTAQVQQNREQFGATTLNDDVQLSFDTSFSGKDLLRTTLRGGNFD